MSEHNLHEWVKKQNRQKGLAPDYMMVWQAIVHQQRGAAGHENRPLGHGHCCKKARWRMLKWVRRWRLRWGAARGRFRPAEHLPMDVLRSKAGGVSLMCVLTVLI